MTTLADLKPGEFAVVQHFMVGMKQLGSYRQRLLSMGLTPNTPVKLIRKAPFGDPIQIQIREDQLSLRRSEAQFIQVKKI